MLIFIEKKMRKLFENYTVVVKVNCALFLSFRERFFTVDFCLFCVQEQFFCELKTISTILDFVAYKVLFSLSKKSIIVAPHHVLVLVIYL